MLADNVRSITPSLTRIFSSMASEYQDVIDLTLGDPDFSPPREVQEAACEAIRSNLAHYSSNEGILTARKLAAGNIRNVYGINCKPDNIILTTGGMGALFLSLFCIINPGDEVIIFSPYYINYLQMIQMCGGRPVIVNSFDVTRGLYVDAAELEKKITSRTKAMIINSPHNPTGCVMPEDELRKAACTASKHNLYIISDEVYRSIIFDGRKHHSIIQFMDNTEKVIIVDSLSKEFSMTGYRIGLACAEENIIRTMAAVQENVAACAPVISQYALARAYNDADNSYILREFQHRRDVICSRLEKVRGLSFMRPSAAFYLFLNIEELGMNAEEFSCRLLKQEHVAVVPGNTYGDDYSGYVRIAFTKDIDALKEACERLKHFAEG